METSTHHVEIHPTGLMTLYQGTRVNFTCFSNFSNAYPRWRINNQVYEITYLPLNFTATKTSFSFIFETRASVSCFYTIFFNGRVIDICSDITHLIPEQVRG